MENENLIQLFYHHLFNKHNVSHERKNIKETIRYLKNEIKYNVIGILSGW